MNELLMRVAENSIFALLLGLMMYLFLPRLLKLIDESIERNTREHMALSLLMLNFERRMNWHEAKVYGINPSVGDTKDEQQRAATEAFLRTEALSKRLLADLHELFERREKKGA